MIRAIIFDFDGVILDSVDIKTRAFARLFGNFGPEVSQKVVNYHLAECGISRFRKFKYIYDEILRRPMPTGELDRLGRTFSELVFDEVSNADWIAGAQEFLESSHEQYLCFVASGTPQDELQEIVKLRRIGKYFRGVYGSPATKEQIIDEILATYGLNRSEVAFVGDAMTDFNAAQKFGLLFVGIAKPDSNPFPDRTYILPDLKILRGFISAQSIV